MRSEVVIFLSFKKNEETKCISMEISKSLKKTVVSLSKVCRSKIFRTTFSIRTLKIHYKKGWSFHKIFDNNHWKFGKNEKGKN